MVSSTRHQNFPLPISSYLQTGDHFYNPLPPKENTRATFPACVLPCCLFHPAIDPWKCPQWVLPLNSFHIILVFGDPVFSDDPNPRFSHADPTCSILFGLTFCKEAIKVEQADSRKPPSGFHTADAHTSLEKPSSGGGGRSCGLADKGRDEKVTFFP